MSNELKQIGNVDTKGHNSIWGRIYDTDGISATLTDGGGLGAKTGLYAVPVLTPMRPEKRQNGRRFKGNGDDMFTLTGQDQHGVMIKSATTKGYELAQEGDCVNIGMPNSKTRRGRVGKGVVNTPSTQSDMGVIIQKSQDYRENGSLRTFNECPTLRSNMGDNYPMLQTQTRIRRLTPIECEKLQGFPINHTAEGINDKGEVYKVSDSQRYKMCGNAVTVDIVTMITKAIKENI